MYVFIENLFASIVNDNTIKIKTDHFGEFTDFLSILYNRSTYLFVYI